MPPFLEHVEAVVGRSLTSIRAHDSKVFVRSSAFRTHVNPTITVTSLECGESMSKLQIHHTPLDANRFPELSWGPPAPNREQNQNDVAENLLVVEDPDAPLPMPVVHGIYYAIPAGKTSIQPDDLASVPGAENTLKGGFKLGLNRRKCVWSGPKPVLDHGEHRYMFQVVALNSSMDTKRLSAIPSRAELEVAVEGKVSG